MARVDNVKVNHECLTPNIIYCTDTCFGHLVSPPEKQAAQYLHIHSSIIFTTIDLTAAAPGSLVHQGLGDEVWRWDGPECFGGVERSGLPPLSSPSWPNPPSLYSLVGWSLLLSPGGRHRVAGYISSHILQQWHQTSSSYIHNTHIQGRIIYNSYISI